MTDQEKQVAFALGLETDSFLLLRWVRRLWQGRKARSEDAAHNVIALDLETSADAPASDQGRLQSEGAIRAANARRGVDA